MAKIRKLDVITANSIAAGEVVERPASVVKELCENAIDAGASQITVEIWQGGIRSILVSDNGSGMDAEDALHAFEAHATSKLTHISDLDSIRSMGFRGEALASIAAISKLTLKTRLVGEAMGTKVSIVGGELEEHVPVGTAEGSSFLVENLFFNVPARHKFLKKDSTEAAKITDLINRFILSHNDISFLLRRDGKVVLHSPGNSDMSSAVYTVFGRELAGQSIEIEQLDQSNPVKVNGVIGRPSAARRSRSSQYIFVNGRSVQSPLIVKAIDEAYRDVLMKGEFAFAILKISIPSSLLDVNVHPQKLEVRFWNESQVFLTVMNCIRDTLYNNLAIRSESSQADDETESSEAKEAAESTDPAAAGVSEESNPAAEKEAVAESGVNPLGDAAAGPRVSDINPEATAAVSETDVPRQDVYVDSRLAPRHPDVFESREQGLPLAENRAGDSDDKDPLPTTHDALTELVNAKIVGVLFTTYIIFEHGDRYTLIDQHAAHERILFERLVAVNQDAEEKSQPLLTPEVLRLREDEIDILDQEKDFFEAIGFFYDRFGEHEVALRSVPQSTVGEYAGSSLRAALDEILSVGTNLGLKANRERVYLAMATTACKAAIKAHDRITEDEIRALVRDLLPLENPYQCPHGRPVLIQNGRSELEKRFRRIV